MKVEPQDQARLIRYLRAKSADLPYTDKFIILPRNSSSEKRIDVKIVVKKHSEGKSIAEVKLCPGKKEELVEYLAEQRGLAREERGYLTSEDGKIVVGVLLFKK